MKYPLTCNTWGHEEIDAIQRVIQSDRFTMGEQVKKFETEFARKFGVKHALMVNSGSSANLVGIAALFFKKNRPLKRGDEILVPAISWATTFHPLQQYGLKLRFVDVDLQTLNMDASQLESALTPQTRALMAVSILGNPAALDVMRKFCDKHDLYFFEDNCESMGATIDGKNCGTFGDIGTFSTFYSHHISTMEGGIIVTDDDELYQLCISLRAHGWTRDQPSDSKIFEKRSDDFFEAYRFILPGYNVRPIEFSGAIGLEQLKKLDRMVEIRRKNAATFQALFQGDDRFIIQKESRPGVKSSWFSFTIILNPTKKMNRSKILGALRDADIEFRIITGGNFLQHDALKHFDYTCTGEITNAYLAHDHGFFVGNFPTEAHDHIQRLHKVLDAAAK
jgi:CDP-6-deoxy-D-xylo-4-hexulose-3-dehydrase